MDYAFPREMTGAEIKAARRRMNLTQRELAELAGCSVKTVERWERSKKPVSGPIVPLLTILREEPQTEEYWRIPPRKYPLRMRYLRGNILCTVIDVDEQNERIQIWNFTRDVISRAFGRNENPTYQEYTEFLESRCFPRQRDKMKLMLRELNLPFYDPLLIIRKTKGRMAEDEYWIAIEE
ncbi:MAG: helix-turn-helix domain-containing protein [Eubacteriales bacterium]|nr:helix-turn-helix domain-containing protein [Eubacteriales bacterium]